MDHQLSDAGPKTTDHTLERGGAQDASVNAPHKLRRTECLPGRPPVVTSRPRQHRQVHERLTACGPSLLAITPHWRPPLVRHANHRDAEPLSQSRNDRENRGEGVHVLVRIEMCQPDALASDSIDLRCQLSLDLLERYSASQAGDDERLPRGAEPSIAFYQAGHAVGREHR